MKRSVMIASAIVTVALAAAVGGAFIMGQGSLRQDYGSYSKGDINSAIKTVQRYTEMVMQGKGSSACKLVTENYVYQTSKMEGMPSDCEGQVDKHSAWFYTRNLNVSELYEISGQVLNDVVYVEVPFDSGEYRMIQDGATWKIDASGDWGEVQQLTY